MRTRETNTPPQTVTYQNTVIPGPRFSLMPFSTAPLEDQRSYGPAIGVNEAILDVEHGLGKLNPCVHYRVEITADALSSGASCSYEVYDGSPKEWRNVFSGAFRTLGGHHASLFTTGSISDHPHGSDLNNWGVSPDYSGHIAVTASPE